MPTQANQDSTKGGKVIEGSKTAIFLGMVKGISVYIPLSGKVYELIVTPTV